jgi:hypothetical protein
MMSELIHIKFKAGFQEVIKQITNYTPSLRISTLRIEEREAPSPCRRMPGGPGGAMSNASHTQAPRF